MGRSGALRTNELQGQSTFCEEFETLMQENIRAPGGASDEQHGAPRAVGHPQDHRQPHTSHGGQDTQEMSNRVSPNTRHVPDGAPDPLHRRRSSRTDPHVRRYGNDASHLK
ncbi:hypothetical protein EYF80_035986 [Liparis tanakae]|uniref:Uncharacterized protein n=1 Tax=Liparis tanakae TaxID=230148 RepID=A0A4Z2GKU8_9TELE|nr:hypothetical protein EYF80_035986 [Liparis tanakae]